MAWPFSWAKQTITRIRPGTRNVRGSEIRDWNNANELEIPGCSMQPAGNSLSQDGRVLGVFDGYTCYCPVVIEHHGSTAWTIIAGAFDDLTIDADTFGAMFDYKAGTYMFAIQNGIWECVGNNIVGYGCVGDATLVEPVEINPQDYGIHSSTESGAIAITLSVSTEPAIQAGDRIRFEGQTFEINGEPNRWTSATGNLNNVLLNLVRWSG